jgi:sialidase-1
MTRNALALGPVAWVAIACAAGAAAGPGLGPAPEKTPLFRAGDAGYVLYRIPGIVVTARGTVLAYCEARRSGPGDWATIDILLRRSDDGGRHWLPPQHIAHHGPPVPRNPVVVDKKLAGASERTVNNPVAIADRDGTVHFLYCAEYARCFAMHSGDDGATWSAPVDITTTAFEPFRPDYAWRVIATGPGHGIQLRGGRLLVPVWLSTGTGGNGHRPSVVATIFSDDHGRTWRRGAIAVPDTPEFIIPNETAAVELADGRVLLNSRSESRPHRRIITTGPDGAGGWSKPAFHDALLEPICEASMVRLSTRPPLDRDRLLFANPDTLDPRPGQRAVAGRPRMRKDLTVKLSYDEGRTWPVSRRLEDGPSGYSDLAVGPDGTIYCVYERGQERGDMYHSGGLTLARFNLAWLTDGRDELPATKE